ncbi:hypothetical protein L1987_13701 [Smallanthus sonchifolius]|uniref:Uncharacterized protein n=1 Tax=Smallanthus sonchifolius TaxID=185202 RepID=A0ACB9JHA1_9ASTR|nr:hypothetical protein L1987_13701 [Smallanthus sonchifolius]
MSRLCSAKSCLNEIQKYRFINQALVDERDHMKVMYDSVAKNEKLYLKKIRDISGENRSLIVQLTTQKNNNQILTERLQKANFQVEHMGMDQKILFGIIDNQIHKKVTEGIKYNSHPPPYSKSGRFADMPVPHVPTPFVCNLSADDYIQTSYSDSFSSCAESDCVGFEDDCDESSSKGNVLNELKSDECNNMSVSKPDICEHFENLYFGSLPSDHDSLRNAISKFKHAFSFVPKSVNAMSCIPNFRTARVIVTDIPQETISNLEFFRLKEDQSLQERNIEERVASSSDVSTSQSSSSSCDDNY